jgi:hypothetical protein
MHAFFLLSGLWASSTVEDEVKVMVQRFTEKLGTNAAKDVSNQVCLELKDAKLSKYRKIQVVNDLFNPIQQALASDKEQNKFFLQTQFILHCFSVMSDDIEESKKLITSIPKKYSDGANLIYHLNRIKEGSDSKLWYNLAISNCQADSDRCFEYLKTIVNSLAILNGKALYDFTMSVLMKLSSLKEDPSNENSKRLLDSESIDSLSRQLIGIIYIHSETKLQATLDNLIKANYLEIWQMGEIASSLFIGESYEAISFRGYKSRVLADDDLMRQSVAAELKKESDSLLAESKKINEEYLSLTSEYSGYIADKIKAFNSRIKKMEIHVN